MKFKKVIIGNHFQEDASCIEIESTTAKYRILAEGEGLKISIMANNGIDMISVQPKATNMVIISQFKQ